MLSTIQTRLSPLLPLQQLRYTALEESTLPAWFVSLSHHRATGDFSGLTWQETSTPCGPMHKPICGSALRLGVCHPCATSIPQTCLSVSPLDNLRTRLLASFPPKRPRTEERLEQGRIWLTSYTHEPTEVKRSTSHAAS